MPSNPSDRPDAVPSASGSPAPSATPSASGRSSSPGPPLSSTDLPLLPRPTAPPSGPSDQLGSVWVTGTITRGGDGPCYRMATDDGRELALYTRADVGLAEGDVVRVRVTPAAFRADCGSDELLRLLEVESG